MSVSALDVVLLSRIQFAMTVAFHFIFPPLTIGLAFLLVIFEWFSWRRKCDIYAWLSVYFGRILGLTFAVGVASGIVMEFQFGTNWAHYSRFVGDVFGAPLAAEGVFSFFLESAFIGLYIYGRDKISPMMRWVSIVMVAIGSTLSAFWILVANSWQQTPAGFKIENGRAVLTNFSEAVFNPSMWPRFLHTMDAALICGAFFVAGVSAYLLLKKGSDFEPARRAITIAVIIGLAASVTEIFPFGHEHARQVARTQPEKFAAIEGVYKTQTNAPLTVFAVPENQKPRLRLPVEIPGLVSWLAYGNVNAKITGFDHVKPEDRPPLFITFVAFHNMVILGTYFVGIMLVSAVALYRRKLFECKWLLRFLVGSVVLPPIAIQLGWIAAEVGRQPWVVYHLLRTADAVSESVRAPQVLASIIMFGIVYAALGALYIYLLVREIRHPLQSVHVQESH